MDGKIVSLEEFDSIHDDIMEGEGIPKSSNNGYVCTKYLGDYSLYNIPHKTNTTYPKTL